MTLAEIQGHARLWHIADHDRVTVSILSFIADDIVMYTSFEFSQQLTTATGSFEL